MESTVMINSSLIRFFLIFWAYFWTDHFSTQGSRIKIVSPLTLELLFSLFGLKFAHVSILDRNSLQSSLVGQSSQDMRGEQYATQCDLACLLHQEIVHYVSEWTSNLHYSRIFWIHE